ncbi:hypothetical protein B0T25DRAFT_181039 [Lasiosphaeria hispida]|uniref:Uncharacterized protein n=1 Tax=Lasiosphaeria hispida TaxID=260671 RepID=A0AAJ0MDB1_9PEZI|nr:hypothetical protein B0T25DRAFT_181039 [Lasiosphaeria hispida]
MPCPTGCLGAPAVIASLSAETGKVASLESHLPSQLTAEKQRSTVSGPSPPVPCQCLLATVRPPLYLGRRKLYPRLISPHNQRRHTKRTPKRIPKSRRLTGSQLALLSTLQCRDPVSSQASHTDQWHNPASIRDPRRRIGCEACSTPATAHSSASLGHRGEGNAKYMRCPCCPCCPCSLLPIPLPPRPPRHPGHSGHPGHTLDTLDALAWRWRRAKQGQTALLGVLTTWPWWDGSTRALQESEN